MALTMSDSVVNASRLENILIVYLPHGLTENLFS
jgi:hypothetical protein